MYSVRGIDNSRLIQSLDLTGLVQMTLEQRWAVDPYPGINLVSLVLIEADARGNWTRFELVEGTSLWATPSDPRPDPDYRRAFAGL